MIVDDFTRFTWTYFLHSKDEASEIIINHIKIVDNIDPKRKVSRIRSDNGIEFKSSIIKDSVNKKEYIISSQLQELLNKMVLLKERTELLLKLLEQSLENQSCQHIFGLKLLTQHVLLKIFL